MKPQKMIAVAENIVVQFEAATRTIQIPVGKKIARDLMNADPTMKDLDFEFEDKKLETLLIKKGDGKPKVSEEEVAKAAASKKKASAKKTAAKA